MGMTLTRHFLFHEKGTFIKQNGRSWASQGKVSLWLNNLGGMCPNGPCAYFSGDYNCFLIQRVNLISAQDPIPLEPEEDPAADEALEGSETADPVAEDAAPGVNDQDNLEDALPEDEEFDEFNDEEESHDEPEEDSAEEDEDEHKDATAEHEEDPAPEHEEVTEESEEATHEEEKEPTKTEEKKEPTKEEEKKVCFQFEFT